MLLCLPLTMPVVGLSCHSGHDLFLFRVLILHVKSRQVVVSHSCIRVDLVHVRGHLFEGFAVEEDSITLRKEMLLVDRLGVLCRAVLEPTKQRVRVVSHREHLVLSAWDRAESMLTADFMSQVTLHSTLPWPFVAVLTPFTMLIMSVFLAV